MKTQRYDHQNDGAFRAIVKAATNKFTADPVEFVDVVGAVLDSGYRVTVADTEGRKNGVDVTSTFRHRIYEQLKLLGKAGEIRRVKVGAAKRGKYLYSAI
jgi:hypothetical protein